MFVRTLMIVGLVSLFLGCYEDETSRDGKESASNPSPTLAAVGKPENRIDSRVEVFGSFSNRESNGEHEWGYEVDLWSHEGTLIGMFTGTSGTRLVGDPPTGILKDLMYNFETGSISFRASLPNVEYEFKGVLSKKELSGKLFDSRSERDDAKKITLPKSRELTSGLSEYPSLDKWKESMAEYVRRRGIEETVK